MMKQKVGNVCSPVCKYQMLSLRYEGKIVSSIFASKMPRKLIPKIAR